MANLKNELFNFINSFVSAIIGGLMTLLGIIIAHKLQSKKEKEQWKTDKQYEVFCELIGILDSIDIQIKVDADIQTMETTSYADANYFNIKLNEINTYIERNKATLFIFMPTEIYSKLMKFNGRIYKLISNQQAQVINFEDFYNTNAFKLIEEAKGIAEQIKSEILK